MTHERSPEELRDLAWEGMRRLQNRGELPDSDFLAFKGSTLIAHSDRATQHEIRKISEGIVREGPLEDPDTVIVISQK